MYVIGNEQLCIYSRVQPILTVCILMYMYIYMRACVPLGVLGDSFCCRGGPNWSLYGIIHGATVV